MKIKISLSMFLINILLGVVLACQAGPLVIAIATPIPEVSPMPINIITPAPTSTPQPTITLQHTATIEPTPASVGEIVTYKSLEITLLDVTTHDLLVGVGLYTWYAKAGDILIDLGVLVRNQNPNKPVVVKWIDVYIVDVYGYSWHPNFSGTKKLEIGSYYYPYNIGFGPFETNGDDTVTFEGDTYLRLVFSTVYDPDKFILFGIENSPLIAFQVRE